MRIVLDTNVLARAATRAAGPARQLLTEIRALGHALVLSDFILGELRRVLGYARVRALFRPPLKQNEADHFIEQLRALSVLAVLPAQPEPQMTSLSTDPDDDQIIGTAVVGHADVICTLDRHLRRSRKVRSYCTKHGVSIMTDVELLRLLRQAT